MTDDHIVPQFYLKKFYNFNQKLFVFDKKYNKYDERSTKSIASIENHNHYGKLKTDEIESYFSKIESQISTSYRQIINDNSSINNLKNKLLMSKFTVMQVFRKVYIDDMSKEYFLNENNLKKIIFNSIYDSQEFQKIPDKTEITKNLEKNRKRFTRETQLSLIEKYQNVMKFRKLNLLKTKIKNPFITSDSPVLFSNKKYGLYEDGLLVKDRVIYFPLTPNLCLKWSELMDRNYSEDTYQQLDLKDNGFLSEKVQIDSIGKKVVEKINILQYLNAERFVISNNQVILEKFISEKYYL